MSRPSTDGSTTRCRRRWPREIGVGGRVRIDLHGRRVGGWVVEDGVGSTPGVAVKPLAGSSGMGPPASLVPVAEWAAWRWAGPLSSFLGTASPHRVVRGRGSGPVPAGESGPPSPGGGSVAIPRPRPRRPRWLFRRQAGSGPGRHAGRARVGAPHRPGPGAGAGAVPGASRPDGHPAAGGGSGGGPAAREVGAGARPMPAWSSGRGPRPGLRSSTVRAAVVLDAHDEAYREERSPDLVGGRCGGRARSPRRGSRGAGHAVPSGGHDRGQAPGHHDETVGEAGVADGRGGRPDGGRPPHRAVLRAPGPAGPFGARAEGRPGGLHPRTAPDASGSWPAPDAGAGPLHTLRRGRGPAGGGRGAAVPAVRETRPGSAPCATRTV